LIVVVPLRIDPLIAPGELAMLILLTPAGNVQVPLFVPLEIVTLAGDDNVTKA